MAYTLSLVTALAGGLVLAAIAVSDSRVITIRNEARGLSTPALAEAAVVTQPSRRRR